MFSKMQDLQLHYSWLQVSDSKVDMSMLVPKVDLANHSFRPNADWEVNIVNGTMTLVATQDIAKGEPVCIDYGSDLDNTRLMQVFGFVVPGNPNDRFGLFLGGQNQPADADLDASHSTSRDGLQQHYLLADPFLKAVGLDSVAEQVDQGTHLHNGQGNISCYKDPDLSRKFSAVLSLPLCASDQHASLANGDDDLTAPNPGMRTLSGRPVLMELSHPWQSKSNTPWTYLMLLTGHTLSAIACIDKVTLMLHCVKHSVLV